MDSNATLFRQASVKISDSISGESDTFVKADNGTQITESDEDNNVGDAMEINITPTPEVDLSLPQQKYHLNSFIRKQFRYYLLL